MPELFDGNASSGPGSSDPTRRSTGGRIDPGPEHWLILKELIEETGAAANLTTNAHLAALAVENGAKLLSFDTFFKRFKVIRLG